MLRCMLLLISLVAMGHTEPRSNGSQQDGSSEASAEDIKLAREFMEGIKKNIAYRAGAADAVSEQVAREHLDAQALLRGFLKLLQRGTPDEKWRSARFLGHLGDRSAIAPLVKALDDRDETLREQVCYGLQSLKAKGEPAESALVKLRRNDSSADVRVAAALTLGRPKDEDAVAAYKLGLKSTKKGWLREICEEELEKMGKLELPLPENVYIEISREEYERIKSDRRGYTVRREIKKGGTIYFEAVERHIESPQIPHWYKVRVEGAGARKKFFD